MKTYRFVVGSWDGGYFDLQCLDDPSLFTQAGSMDEAIVMTRDLLLCMREEADVQIELIVPARFKMKSRRAPRSKRKISSSKNAPGRKSRAA